MTSLHISVFPWLQNCQECHSEKKEFKRHSKVKTYPYAKCSDLRYCVKLPENKFGKLDWLSKQKGKILD